jgi:hypothetical protein
VRRHHKDVPVQFRLVPHEVRPRLKGEHQEWVNMWTRGLMEMVGGPDTAGLTKSQLAAAPVASSQGQGVSFNEVVRHYSHVEGGVHQGVPNSDLSRLLAAIAPTFRETPADAIRVLVPMGIVVVDGLTPLLRRSRQVLKRRKTPHHSTREGAGSSCV